VFLVLFFVPAWVHVAETDRVYVEKPLRDASSTTLSEESKWLILQFPTPSSTRVWLFTAMVHVPYNMESLII